MEVFSPGYLEEALRIKAAPVPDVHTQQPTSELVGLELGQQTLMKGAS